jgi:hypothetical protein
VLDLACLPACRLSPRLSLATISGAMDGITGMGEGSVDGMPLSRHLATLEQLRIVLETSFSTRLAAAAAKA